jgi:hypothetical protein
MPAKAIAAMGLGVPAAPTGTHQPTDAIASSLLRDSAALKTAGDLLRIVAQLPRRSQNAFLIDHPTAP